MRCSTSVIFPLIHLPAKGNQPTALSRVPNSAREKYHKTSMMPAAIAKPSSRSSCRPTTRAEMTMIGSAIGVTVYPLECGGRVQGCPGRVEDRLYCDPRALTVSEGGVSTKEARGVAADPPRGRCGVRGK